MFFKFFNEVSQSNYLFISGNLMTNLNSHQTLPFVHLNPPSASLLLLSIRTTDFRARAQKR